MISFGYISRSTPELNSSESSSGRENIPASGMSSLAKYIPTKLHPTAQVHGANDDHGSPGSEPPSGEGIECLENQMVSEGEKQLSFIRNHGLLAPSEPRFSCRRSIFMEVLIIEVEHPTPLPSSSLSLSGVIPFTIRRLVYTRLVASTNL